MCVYMHITQTLYSGKTTYYGGNTHAKICIHMKHLDMQTHTHTHTHTHARNTHTHTPHNINDALNLMIIIAAGLAHVNFNNRLLPL